MGAYKELLIKAEEGDHEAISLIADIYARRRQYNQALLFYKKINDKQKIQEVLDWQRLEYEDDIFG